MNNYNPYTAAIVAAFAELSSPRAQAYYSLRAQQDIQATVDTAVTIGSWLYQVAVMAYTLGKQCRYWVDAPLTQYKTLIQPPMLPPVRCAGLLPLSVPMHPDNFRQLRRQRKVLAIAAAQFVGLTSRETLITLLPKRTRKKPVESKGKPAPKHIEYPLVGRKKPTTVRGVAIN